MIPCIVSNSRNPGKVYAIYTVGACDLTVIYVAHHT